MGVRSIEGTRNNLHKIIEQRLETSGKLQQGNQLILFVHQAPCGRNDTRFFVH